MPDTKTDKERPAIENPPRKYLTAEEIADTSRYQFEEEDLYLPELGGWVKIRPLSVEARLELPSARDENGNWNPSIDTMAASFAAIIVEPDLTAEQCKAFLGKMPGSAYDAVQLKLAELVGSVEEARATRKEFRPAKD